MSKISVHDLMTICRVLLLIIGQNDINPKLPQPIVTLICKVMTVKKPCVYLCLKQRSSCWSLAKKMPKCGNWLHPEKNLESPLEMPC